MIGLFDFLTEAVVHSAEVEYWKKQVFNTRTKINTAKRKGKPVTDEMTNALQHAQEEYAKAKEAEKNGQANTIPAKEAPTKPSGLLNKANKTKVLTKERAAFDKIVAKYAGKRTFDIDGDTLTISKGAERSWRPITPADGRRIIEAGFKTIILNGEAFWFSGEANGIKFVVASNATSCGELGCNKASYKNCEFENNTGRPLLIGGTSFTNCKFTGTAKFGDIDGGTFSMSSGTKNIVQFKNTEFDVPYFNLLTFDAGKECNPKWDNCNAWDPNKTILNGVKTTADFIQIGKTFCLAKPGKEDVAITKTWDTNLQPCYSHDNTGKTKGGDWVYLKK